MSRLACHTAEQTRLYARGYPYLTILVDDHKDDKNPALSATNVFREYYGIYHARWPRRVAHAFARASAVARDGDWSTDEVAKAASSTADVTADEARTIIRALLADGRCSGGIHQTFHAVFTLEAIASTDVVLDAIVSGLEALPNERWNAADPNESGDDDDAALLAFATGFLLLRTTNRAAFEKRLEALYAATIKANAALGEETVRGALDLALHGTDGAKRALASSHWQYWYYYLMVDDPELHLTRLANTGKSEWVPEARILWLAGESLFPAYTSKKALRQGKRLPSILSDFGMFAHDAVLSLMVEMVGIKGAGEAPRDYFRENAAYAAPKLARLAKGSGAAAVKAKAALTMCNR
jgi:hypothetical protein